MVPGSLVAVLAGIVAVQVFGLDERGVDIVGRIDGGLPSLGLPGVAAADYLALAAAAIGVMLVGFAEGLGAAKTYAARHHYEVDANRELLGLGAANLAAGLSSGMVVNGSLSKTAVNGSAGARSQVSGLVVAALTVVTLLFDLAVREPPRGHPGRPPRGAGLRHPAGAVHRLPGAVVLDAETIPPSTSPPPGCWSSSTTSSSAGGCGW